MSDLKSKTLKGLFWSGIDQFGMYFIRFGFTIWIARLLSPEDYGLIGLMAIFIAVAGMFTESGLNMALIQKKNADQKDFSTVFWFNIIVGFFFYIIIFSFSEEIAYYFNEPRLESIAKVVSLSLIIGPFAGIQSVRLSKEINFKKQTKISFVVTIISGTTGVILAIKGFAVWALIFQTLIGAFIRSLLLWVSSSWKPANVFSIKRFKELYNYGWKIFLQGLSNAIFTNMYYPFIGKYFSTADLGFYTRGKRFYDTFILQTTIAYGQVAFPVFSSIQNETERFFHAYIKTYRLLILFFFPLVTILIATTDPFIHFFLTEKWMPAAPYIKMFFLMGLFYPIYMLNQNIFNALGRSGLSLKVDILSKILLFSSLILTYKFGILAIIGGQVVAGLLAYIITSFLIQKIIAYSISEQFVDYFPVMIISLIIFFLLKFIETSFTSDIVSMLITFLIGLLSFILLFRILKIRTYTIFKEDIVPHLPKQFHFIF